ncbi:thiamine pyrophosphate-dependent enzyme [Leisingera sp. MMG026]|uniref:thiamine pyrophosphate-dependent enzyme n=1 Tax=Leisingera sp. MMG026 TaxID=2909982 RepID=UPI0031CCD06C|nr:thiamine pyrophosphate-dependent enzyme [Leisingera sp. MMG026]
MIFAGGGIKWGKGREALTALAETLEVPVVASTGHADVMVVLDNEAWGAEKAYQQEFYGGRLLGAEITSPRYDKFAELCGGKGIWVDGPGGMDPALEAALASNETTIIQGKTDPGALMTLRKDLFKAPKLPR